MEAANEQLCLPTVAKDRVPKGPVGVISLSHRLVLLEYGAFTHFYGGYATGMRWNFWRMGTLRGPMTGTGRRVYFSASRRPTSMLN